MTLFKFVFLSPQWERNLSFRATLQTNQHFFIINCHYVQGFLILDEFQTRKSKVVARDISLDEKSRALLPSIYMHLRYRHKDAPRSCNNSRNSWFKIKLKPLTFVKKKRHVFLSTANKTYVSLYSSCNVPSQIEVKERFLTRSRVSVCRPVVQSLTLVFSCFCYCSQFPV